MHEAIGVVAYERGQTYNYPSLNSCCEEYGLDRYQLLSCLIEPDMMWHGISFDFALTVTDQQVAALSENYYAHRAARKTSRKRGDKDGSVQKEMQDIGLPESASE